VTIPIFIDVFRRRYGGSPDLWGTVGAFLGRREKYRVDADGFGTEARGRFEPGGMSGRMSGDDSRANGEVRIRARIVTSTGGCDLISFATHTVLQNSTRFVRPEQSLSHSRTATQILFASEGALL
jgi:hypothetical protein